jgi:hypothetical protein
MVEPSLLTAGSSRLGAMATKDTDEPLVHMATRLPAALLQRVKIHCVEREKMVMEFVAEALREKLRRVRSR